MTGCPHGMPSKASCFDCMNDEGLGAPATPAVTVEAVFAARYDGHCGSCNLPISVGQRVAKLSTERYVHEDCV